MNHCKIIHNFFQNQKRLCAPFDSDQIPLNGIYILFEKNEDGHGGQRIVRVGTHTGENQLRSRMNQHFVNENKDRSIFRKNIGRALLNKRNNPFLKYWNLDLTTKTAKNKHSLNIDLEKQKALEAEVTKYLQENFSFIVFEVPTKEDRLDLESKIISTISHCEECRPSTSWLGLHSPISKISESGLWLVQGLWKTPVNDSDIEKLKAYCSQPQN